MRKIKLILNLSTGVLILGGVLTSCGHGFNTDNSSVVDSTVKDSATISKEVQAALDSLENDTTVKLLINDTTDTTSH